MKKVISSVRARIAAFLMLAFVALMSAVPASAQTDITGVIDAVDGYRTEAIVVGIAILLFVLGRSVVRKLAK